IEQLQGAPLSASTLEDAVLGARVRDYRPAWLDELAAAGEVVWLGRGALGSGDGRIALYLRDQAPLLAPPRTDPREEPWCDERHRGMLDLLATRGASFWPQLYTAAGGGPED